MCLKLVSYCACAGMRVQRKTPSVSGKELERAAAIPAQTGKLQRWMSREAHSATCRTLQAFTL